MRRRLERNRAGLQPRGAQVAAAGIPGRSHEHLRHLRQCLARGTHKKLERVARAMCSGGANQTDDGGLLAGLAEVIGTGETDLVGVWTDNWQTVLAFSDLMSQWNVGMSGV